MAWREVYKGPINHIPALVQIMAWREVYKGPINHIPALVQIMAWRRPGDKPISDRWWLVYRRIYGSFGLNYLRFQYWQNLQCSFSRTVIVNSGLNNKFLTSSFCTSDVLFDGWKSLYILWKFIKFCSDGIIVNHSLVITVIVLHWIDNNS